MTRELEFYISYMDLFPGISETDYIDYMNNKKSSATMDKIFSKLFDLDDVDNLTEFLNAAGYNVNIDYLNFDFDGVEIPQPYFELEYESDSEINDEDIKKKMIEFAHSVI